MRTLVLFGIKLQYYCKRRQDLEEEQSDKAAKGERGLTFRPTTCFVTQRKETGTRDVAGLKRRSRVIVLSILEQPKPLLILILSLKIVLV